MKSFLRKDTPVHPYGPTNTRTMWNERGEREIWYSYDGGKTWILDHIERPA